MTNSPTNKPAIDIQKWNFKTHEYEPYAVPDDVTVVLYSQDMDLPINCASCFKAMIYGKGFTSRTLHNRIGLAYPVCEDCYGKEWDAEIQAKEPTQ